MCHDLAFAETSAAGAPEAEIVITPAMIDAGVDAIARFFSFELGDPETVVSSVFSAMIQQSRVVRSG